MIMGYRCTRHKHLLKTHFCCWLVINLYIQRFQNIKWGELVLLVGHPGLFIEWCFICSSLLFQPPTSLFLVSLPATGAIFWLLFLPAWVLFLVLQVNQKDPSLTNFPPTLPSLETFWDFQAFGFVLLWILFQALLYILPVGKVSDRTSLICCKTTG